MGYDKVKLKSNSKYLKIESGSPQDIRLLNDSPFEKLVHSLKTGNIECNGEGCLNCADGEIARQRFVTNVYNHGNKSVQIWEYGVAIAKQLKSIAVTLIEEGQSITNIDLKVEASGSGLSKKYSVTPRTVAKPIPEGLKLHKIADDIPF